MVGARRVLPGFLFAAAFALPAAAQDGNVGALSGTLKKIKDTGTITLGHRESSLPFSYLNKRQQPIGYSIDLCREIVEEAATELDGMDIKISFAPVTAAYRLDKVKVGEKATSLWRWRLLVVEPHSRSTSPDLTLSNRLAEVTGTKASLTSRPSTSAATSSAISRHRSTEYPIGWPMRLR
jgi:hypothetical protein